MAITVKLNKKIISLTTTIFDLDLVYKTTKTALEEEGYIFSEKEQAMKTDQYGQQVNFEFQGDKEYDEFCRVKITITAKFKDMEKVKVDGKNMQKGVCEMLIIPVAEIDYKNKWGKDSFGEFIFSLYTKFLKRKELDDKYFDVGDAEVVRIYEKIKDALELYK